MQAPFKRMLAISGVYLFHLKWVQTFQNRPLIQEGMKCFTFSAFGQEIEDLAIKGPPYKGMMADPFGGLEIRVTKWTDDVVEFNRVRPSDVGLPLVVETFELMRSNANLFTGYIRRENAGIVGIVHCTVTEMLGEILALPDSEIEALDALLAKV